VRTQNEMSTATKNESGLIAREAVKSLNSGALLGQAAQNAVTVAAVNVIAKGLVDNLKSGGLLKGTVRANSKIGDVDAVWVVVQLPLLGERQILVRDSAHLRVGQDVMIECVPTLSHSKRYVFRMANGTLTAANDAAAKPSCH
jgi:hypothetical protein